MSNQTLEEKIRGLSADYIYQQAVGSLLLLLSSAVEEAEEKALPYPLHADVIQIRSEVRNYLLSLEKILDADASLRTEAMQHCFSLKKDLLAIYETVYSYFSRWGIFSTLISDQIALRKYKEESLANKDVEWSLFFADCHGFMENAETLLEQKSRMGQLLKCLPLFMTRDNFFDAVSKSLEMAFQDESTPYISASLKAFEGFSCPESNPAYGKYFPEIAKWLGEKSLLLPHSLSDEALDALYQDMGEMFDCLSEIEEYFSCILHDINSLILLFCLTYGFAELTQADVVYDDLYYAVCEFINGDWSEVEKASYLERLHEELEAAIEPVLDKATAMAKEEYTLLQKVGSFAEFHEDTKKILMTEEFIRDCFFTTLNEVLFRFDLPEGLPPAKKSERDALFSAFISKTRSNFDTLPVQTRKIAMQTLMGALPPVYTPQEVMDMVMSAVDTLSEKEQRILLVDKVGMVFVENGYTSIANEAPHAHHTHEHACDCGHGHHDHNCNCDHHKS